MIVILNSPFFDYPDPHGDRHVLSQHEQLLWQKLTACNVKIACLLVEGEECEVHPTDADQGHPDAVEDVTVGEDTDIEVRGEDAVEPGDLLVPEEGVRHPHLACICHGQVPDFT